MGFCFFNNVAVAAAHARAAHGAERVLIVDWDVHHGNGTNDIFHADSGGPVRLDPPVAAVSGHGPGGGRGQRAGRGVHRQPARPVGLRGRASTARWWSTWSRALARAWRPQLVLVSAGFDAHRADPLAGCRVTEAGIRGA